MRCWDVVQLGELPTSLGRDELLKLGGRLAAQIRAVHKKQHASCARVLDQRVDECAGRVRLARAGRHLDERARPRGGERLLETRDRFDLTAAHAVGGQRRERAQAGAESIRLVQPSLKRFRPVKGKHLARARLGVSAVTEERFDPRGLVVEGQRTGRALQELWQVAPVVRGLFRDHRQRRSHYSSPR